MISDLQAIALGFIRSALEGPLALALLLQAIETGLPQRLVEAPAVDALAARLPSFGADELAALPAEVLVQIVDKASSEPEPDAGGESERGDDDPHHVSRCACRSARFASALRMPITP